MQQAQTTVEDFEYGGPQDAAGLPARVAIFADLASMRAEISRDLEGAGFRALDGGEIAALLDGPITILGDVVMVDCPVVDARTLAALARLDMRVARSDARLIVTTSLEALDDVFAAFDQSEPQILVQPSRAERIVAVGRVMAEIGTRRVCEMEEQDRVALLRLSQQVDQIAQELDRLSFNDGKQEYRAPQTGFSGAGGISGGRWSLPDPRHIRQIIAARQARSKFFEGDLFADPAWDMLLDLTAAHAERANVSVTSLCIAAGVPATTALRWIKQLVESGVFERVADTSDKRRAFIALSERSLASMGRYFAEVRTPLDQAA